METIIKRGNTIMESPYLISEQDQSKTQCPQAPQKYPRTGPNYAHWGEQGQSGYVYNPFTDQYYIDPKAYQQWEEQTGMKEKAPGLMETLMPIAGAGLAGSAGKAIGAQIPGMLSGLFGGGSATAATTGATAGAGTVGAGTAGALGTGAATAGTGAATGGVAGAGATGAGTAGAGVTGSGLLGLAPFAGVAGGLALGAKGIKDLINDKETKGLEGWGGRATLGIATGGLSEVARAFGLFGGPTTNVEDKKLQQLKDKGILPENYQINEEERSREQQVKDLQAQGQEVPKFLQTGNVADLTPTDIQGYATLLERNPNSLEARLQDAQDALAAGAVKEGKGSISVDWDKVAEYKASKPKEEATQKSFGNLSPNSPEYAALSKEEKNAYWRSVNG